MQVAEKQPPYQRKKTTRATVAALQHTFVGYARIIGQKFDVKVVFGGSPKTNGRTIWIPRLPYDLEPEELYLVRSDLVHEVGHIRYSDFEYLKDFVKHHSKFAKGVLNALEDAWMERQVDDDLPGAGQNIRHSLPLADQRGRVKTGKNSSEAFEMLCYFYGSKVLSGWAELDPFYERSRKALEQTMSEENILEVEKMIAADLPKSQSTADNGELTLKLIRFLEDLADQMDQQKEDEKDGESGESDDSQPGEDDNQQGEGESSESNSEGTDPASADDDAGEEDDDTSSDSDGSDSSSDESDSTDDPDAADGGQGESGSDSDDTGDSDSSADGGQNADEDDNTEEANGAGDSSSDSKEDSGESTADNNAEGKGDNSEEGDSSSDSDSSNADGSQENNGEGQPENDDSSSDEGGNSSEDSNNNDDQDGSDSSESSSPDQSDSSGDGAAGDTDPSESDNPIRDMLEGDPGDKEVVDFEGGVEDVADEIDQDPERSKQPKVVNTENSEVIFGTQDLAQYNIAKANVQSQTGVVASRLQVILQSLVVEDFWYEKRGRLSGKRLARIPLDDPYIFEQREVTELPRAAVSVLNDLSGSTEGSCAELIQQTNILLGESMELVGNPCELLGFGSEAGRSNDLLYIKGFDEPLGPAKPRLGGAIQDTGGGTPLAQTLFETALRLMAREEERKLLFVLTDGQPNNAQEVIDFTKRVEASGMDVFFFLIGNDVPDWLAKSGLRHATVRDIPSVGIEVLTELQRALTSGR